ncbi:HAMP domain-containing histidine kinase [Candidatus Marinimicrobia bacterium]|nr:HAMP domain-containing histidine kinase [Candidatus Neomarinimicrobiota bacterium]
MNLPTTLKSRLFLVFGSLMVILMFIASITVFEKMKTLILEKHLESAQRVNHMGTIPLVDGLLAAETGRTLPVDYYERSLRTLMKQSKQEILYAYFLDENGQSLLPKALNNVNIINPENFKLGTSLSYQQNGWVLQTMYDVSVSTKVWGYLVLGFDAVQIHQEVKQVLFLIYVTSGIVILIVLFATNIIAETMTRRLNQLSVAVDRFNLVPDSKALPESDDEIGKLATNFNQFRQRLLQSRLNIEQSERNLFQAEKLASIGRLAAGVAHEINNPLTGIRHSINNILEDDPSTVDRNQYLNLIDDALKNIESVISKLLGFSRLKGDDHSDSSMNDAISTVVKLLDFSIQSKSVDFISELDLELPSVHCNSNVLDELAMNLIMNAIDASDVGGKILCTTSFDNNNILFCIEDWGHGIRDRDIPKIFEPFFTTKDVGRGTGLGLYVTQEIVRGLGGKIHLSKIPHPGAKFKIKLPATIS